MTSFITYLKLLFRRCNRKSLHSQYIYSRKIEICNKLVGMILNIDTETPIKTIRKERRSKGDNNSYIICRISEEDLLLLSEAKDKLKLIKKYRRRIILLNS